MKQEITLLYFDGCPFFEKARENLKTALEKKNKPPQWKEVDLRSANCPLEWRGFPSPTILVNGQDIMSGETKAEGTTSCRRSGGPELSLIMGKLTDTKGD